MIAAPFRLLRNLVVNALLLLRNLLTLVRSGPEFVRFELKGALGERTEKKRLLGKRKLSLDDLREAFDEIGRDQKVRGVVLEIRRLEGGWARLETLRQLVLDLRKSGKEVIAELRAAENADYYVACAANQVIITPQASMGLTGLASEIRFLATPLERLGIEVDMHAIGPYKTAVDPLRRSAMSREHRDSLQGILGSLSEGFLQSIAAGRGISPECAKAKVDAGPYTPEHARDAGLCDAVLYADELAQYLGSEEKPARISSLKSYRSSRAQWSWTPLRSGRVIGIVPVHGMIVDGEGGRGPLKLCGGDAVERALEAARKNPRVAGVVLHIDSRGGSAAASDGIWRQASRIARDKPVVAFLGDIAASGGYYAACAAHSIVAQPTTITGSIGIIGGKISMQQLYARLGINVELLLCGDNAAMLSSARPFSPAQRQHFARDLQFYYEEFLWRVSAARAMTVEVCHRRGEGRVFTGLTATKLGLVDKLGGLQTAVDEARSRARRGPRERVPVADIPVVPRRSAPLSKLLGAAVPLAVWPDWLRISVLALILGGCATSARPEEVVRTYADAVERGDVTTAWSLLTPETKARYSREEFAEALRRDPHQSRELASQLRRTAASAEVRAQILYGDEGRLQLVRDGGPQGPWRLDVDPLTFYRQDSPRQALRSFVRALERRRYAVLMRLAPKRWRDKMTQDELEKDFEGPRKQEITKLIVTLKKHLDDPIQEDGPQAELSYGDGAKVTFSLEERLWVVVDTE